MLCTVEQVKARLSLASDDDEHDDMIEQIVLGVSEALCGPAGAGRPLEEAQVTQVFDVPTPVRVLLVERFPIVAVDEVREGWLGGFDDEADLMEGEDFVVAADAGRLIRVGGHWLLGDGTVRAKYRGGYVPPDVSREQAFGPAEGQVLMPQDIVEAAIQQSVHWFQRRSQPGVTGEGVAGANLTFYAATELLPGVKEILGRYRRIVC